MPFKNIDNPWLVKVLLSMLTLFGVVFGAALAPLLVVLFNPAAQEVTDAYAKLDQTEWYKYGAIGGGIFGFLLAVGILAQLTRQAELERTQIASGEHAPAAH